MHTTVIRQALAEQVSYLRAFLRNVIPHDDHLATAEQALDGLTALREGLPSDWYIVPLMPAPGQLEAAWAAKGLNPPWRSDWDFIRWYMAMVGASPVPRPLSVEAELDHIETRIDTFPDRSPA